jgi:hypothetical protein
MHRDTESEEEEKIRDYEDVMTGVEKEKSNVANYGRKSRNL